MGHFISSLVTICVIGFFVISAIIGILGFAIMTRDMVKAAKEEIKLEREIKQIRREIFDDKDD